MASNARLFVDFFGTLHASVDAIRGNRVMLSRQRVPHVVLLASVACVWTGQALMEYVYDRVVRSTRVFRLLSGLTCCTPFVMHLASCTFFLLVPHVVVFSSPCFVSCSNKKMNVTLVRVQQQCYVDIQS